MSLQLTCHARWKWQGQQWDRAAGRSTDSCHNQKRSQGQRGPGKKPVARLAGPCSRLAQSGQKKCVCYSLYCWEWAFTTSPTPVSGKEMCDEVPIVGRRVPHRVEGPPECRASDHQGPAQDG